MSKQRELADAIAAWLKARPNRSLNVLSRLLGTDASYSSIRRAAQGEVEQEQSIVIAIAGVVMGEDEFRAFVRTYYPQLERAVVDVKGQDKNDAADNESAVVDFLKSDHHAKILMIAASRTGTTDEEVVRKWGEQSLSYFNDIKNSGVLRYNDGSWFFDGSVGNVSQALARRVLCSLVKEFDPRNDSINYASFSYLIWESFNKSGLEKLYKANETHAKTVYDIAHDPENHGDILGICGLVQNVMKGSEGLS